MKIVLLTVHDAASGRKVDFHFWADVFEQRKIMVDFVTVGFSPVTLAKPGGRSYPRPYNSWVELSPFISKFVWCAPLHPFNAHQPILNRLLGFPFRLYGAMMPDRLLRHFGDCDLFIVENGAGLLLIPRLKKLFPKAQFIYSVCDRIETLDYHPVILEAEQQALRHVDLVRVPSPVMEADYKGKARVAFIPHGLDKSLFDKDCPNPYSSPRNAVSVGDMLFDANAIAFLADRYPDWTFHLFGRGAKLDRDRQNVKTHGEVPFNTLIPYLKHADIGLAPYRPAVNADYVSQSSLKMIQYTYCRLPIVAPAFAASGRDHVLPYDPTRPETIASAFQQAIIFNRSQIDPAQVRSWTDTVDEMMKAVTCRDQKTDSFAAIS
jgi:2-beta-glucuronyltransferase